MIVIVIDNESEHENLNENVAENEDSVGTSHKAVLP
jgi:hypothetical protein